MTGLMFNVGPTLNQDEITPATPPPELEAVLVREDLDERDKDGDVRMDVDEGPSVWGMPKWGCEEERKEVRKGVRLIGMEEVSLGRRLGKRG